MIEMSYMLIILLLLIKNQTDTAVASTGLGEKNSSSSQAYYPNNGCY